MTTVTYTTSRGNLVEFTGSHVKIGDKSFLLHGFKIVNGYLDLGYNCKVEVPADKIADVRAAYADHLAAVKAEANADFATQFERLINGKSNSLGVAN